jgi:hypothetical protein
LTKKVESENLFLLSSESLIYDLHIDSAPTLQTEVEPQALEAMVENVVAFFYPNDPSSATRAP